MTTQPWQERFMDFYMERGEYTNRKLGPQEYIDFIALVEQEAREAGRQEILTEVKNKKEMYEPAYEPEDKAIVAVLGELLTNHNQ